MGVFRRWCWHWMMFLREACTILGLLAAFIFLAGILYTLPTLICAHPDFCLHSVCAVSVMPSTTSCCALRRWVQLDGIFTVFILHDVCVQEHALRCLLFSVMACRSWARRQRTPVTSGATSPGSEVSGRYGYSCRQEFTLPSALLCDASSGPYATRISSSNSSSCTCGRSPRWSRRSPPQGVPGWDN